MYKPVYTKCKARTFVVLSIAICWVISEVFANANTNTKRNHVETVVRASVSEQGANRSRKDEIPSGITTGQQGSVPTSSLRRTSLLPELTFGPANEPTIPVKKKRQGGGNGRRYGLSVTSVTNNTRTRVVHSTPSADAAEDQHVKLYDDGYEEEIDEDDDDDVVQVDNEDDDGIDVTADDILTDGNYDEKLQTSSSKKDPRPNIILILTDDQDIELGSMEHMPETLRVFRDNGIEFRHGYVTTPMCCPSRSSILTGLYVHNHQVYTNHDNCSSIQWRENFEKKTFASYLWDSGYYTSYIGKYLNKYDGSHIPYGWDEWNALLMNSKFYNYTVNRNGVKMTYGNNYKRDYYPNSIANDTINFLRRMMAESPSEPLKFTQKRMNSSANGTTSTNKRKVQQPFLLVASFPSPHGPEDSAPEYKDMFLNTTAHHTPSYNYAPNLDKQWILRVTSKMNPTLKNFTNLLMTKRLQTLQSVDLAVYKIMNLLDESGLSDNTYVFYTSDHGYHVGQFGLVKGKSMPYEFDVRVPFFLSPPKRKSEEVPPPGTVIHEPVLNIDLAPTFMELGNLQTPDDMDGRSMTRLLRKYSRTRHTISGTGNDYIDDDAADLEWASSFLIESSGRRSRRESGHPNSPDQATDSVSNPYEIFDSGTEVSAVSKQPKSGDRYLIENETAANEQALCQLHPYPCQLGQKKYCRKEKNRLRFRKCRYDVDFVQSSSSLHFGLNTSTTDGETFGSWGHGSGQKCKCPGRTKRDTNVTDEYDWEKERQLIDDEIELLKLRIEQLRERRRNIRRKYSKESTPSHTYVVNVNANSTGNGGAQIQPSHRNVSSRPVLSVPSSFLPISTGHGKRQKKVKNNNVPIPTRSSFNNVTFLNAFNLYPKIDFTTFLNIDEFGHRGSGISRNGATGRPGQDTRLLNSEESFEDYEDLEEDIFENDDDEENENFDHTLGQNQGARKSTNIDEANRNQNSESNRYDGTGEGQRSTVEMQRSGRKKTKDHRNKSTTISSVNPLVIHSDLENTGSDGECNCNGGNPGFSSHWMRQQEREERKRKKLMSRLRKKQRYLHRIVDADERHQAETCGSEDKMNCFWHDRSHWRTEPKWTLDSFCFCMNANNNSYSCIRTVNSSHNFLYCHFITGFKMYFDLNRDPYQLRNAIGTLPAHEEDWMLATLVKLKKCQGHRDCFVGNESLSLTPEEEARNGTDSEKLQSPDVGLGGNRSSRILEPSIWDRIFGSRKKKNKKHRNQTENNNRRSRN